jgi:membrane protease YdiL (CAAX protease family)
MKKILVLIFAIVIWRAKILLTGLVPKISFIKKLVDSVEWLSSSHIVQFSMLIIAILLIIIIGKGKFSNFGFNGAPVKTVLRSVFLSFGVSIVLFLAFGIYMKITSSVASSGASFLEGSFLSNIILVWIIASSVEEIFYRGFLQTFLEPLKDIGLKFGKVYLSLPVILTALMFGFMHLCLKGKLPWQMVRFIIFNATVLGLIAGYYREKTGSLIPAYFVHLTFNVVGMGLPRILMMVMKG